MTVGRTRSSGLDLVRVAAIALVLLHHLRSLPGTPDSLRSFALRGYAGVDLFFVLSGWLIGGQLWRELDQRGRIDLPRFWRRRLWRTLPAYFAVLLALTLSSRVPIGALPVLALFVQNHLAPEAWLSSWSLCIEEQFYLLAPIVLALLGAPRARLRSTGLVILPAALVSWALRADAYDELTSAGYEAFLTGFYVRTPLRLDGLAIGVALSWAACHHERLWRWVCERRGLLALLGLTLCATPWIPAIGGGTSEPLERLLWFNAVPGFFVVSGGAALLMPWALQLRTPELISRPLAVLADHTYAIYLVHEAARDLVLHIGRSRKWSCASWWILSLAMTALMAALLHRYVERPGLERRERAATSAPPPAAP